VKKYLAISVYSVLALGALLVFWQVRSFEFINYDDNVFLTENPHFSHGLNRDDIIWAFTTPNVRNWLPLTWLSFMLDSQLFGLNPYWMHLENLFLHIANTLLLFAILKRITGSLWPSAFVSAAFALHPMHVESVAWIIERKDVLSTLFLLLTLAAYVGYVRRRSLVSYMLTVLLFALGLLAKPMLVTLPFVLLLLDYWPLDRFAASQTIKTPSGEYVKPVPVPERRRILHRVIVEKIPFLALAAVSGVITFLSQQNSGEVATYRIANVFLSYVRYIGKMFWPQNMAVFYPFENVSIPTWQIVLCVLILLIISIFAVRFGREQRYLPVGWFWFVGTLIPVIGLVQSGVQSYADRYTYIPYIGLFIVIAWGLPELLSKWLYRKIARGIAAAMVLTAMGIGTYRQVGYWKNSSTLFTHAIEVTQNNYIAHNNLGVAYGNLGRYQDAIESCKQAIKIKPDYVDAHCNLGTAYLNLGRYQDAIESCKQAIKIKPDYAEAHNNLGVAYGNLGCYQDAIESCKQAIKIKPDYAEAHNNLGFAYSNLGRYQDAIESYKQAIKIKPDYAEAHNNLGNAYLMTGDKGSALEECKILKTLDTKQANELFTLIYK